MTEDLFIADPTYDALPDDRLRELLRSGTKSERARAMGALARRAASNPSLRAEVLAALTDPDHRAMRIMGTISIAHIGVACLYRASDDDVRRQVQQLITAWPEPDRTDLLWFLRSQSLSV